MRRVKLFEESIHISYLEGNGNYTLVHFIDGSALLLAKTLSLCMNELPQFARIHKRHAVNPQHILDLKVNSPKTAEVLVGSVWLAISRRRLPEVLERLQPQKVRDA
jgi:two-component system LytT family response regulator